MLAKYSKGIAAAVGALIIILNLFFPGKYDEYVAAGISVLTVLGVVFAPKNAD